MEHVMTFSELVVAAALLLINLAYVRLYKRHPNEHCYGLLSLGYALYIGGHLLPKLAELTLTATIAVI